MIKGTNLRLKFDRKVKKSIKNWYLVGSGSGLFWESGFRKRIWTVSATLSVMKGLMVKCPHCARGAGLERSLCAERAAQPGGQVQHQ